MPVARFFASSRHREEAGGERAPDAGHAVHRDRADRVVDPDPLDAEHADDGDRRPATRPITIAAHGATKPHAAVIATSAAITPFSIIERSGFLSTIQAVTIPPSAPAAAARFVVSAT